MLIFPKLLLGYQDLPKNASTTTFAWLFECLYGYSWLDKVKAANGAPLHIHKFFWSGQRLDSHQVDNASFAANAPHDLFTFALTRDPIKRFLSMYSNRVQHFNELSSNSPAAPRLREHGLQPSPDVNQLAEQLEQYLTCDESIYHHTRPMTDFLGNDLSIYTCLSDVAEMDSLIERIRQHWRKHGLQQLVEQTPRPLRLQTGGSNPGLEVLTPKAFEHLLEYYAADYEWIPTIDRRKIKQEYAQARTIVDQLGNPASSNQLTYHTQLTRKDNLCPVVDLLWVDEIPATVSSTGNLTISGALVLRRMIERDDWELIALDRQGQKSIPWHFKSPNMAKQFPDRKDAATARFQIHNLKLSDREPVELYVQSSEGKRWHLLSLTAER